MYNQQTPCKVGHFTGCFVCYLPLLKTKLILSKAIFILILNLKIYNFHQKNKLYLSNLL